MNTKRLKERLAGGVDQRNIPESNRATDIVNMRVDTEGLGWVGDRGWEPYFPTAGFTLFDADAIYPVTSLHVFDAKQGSQTTCLMERNGSLLWQHGLEDGTGQTALFNQTLDVGRHIPKPDDPGTQYVEHQDFLLIVNGVDTPLKYRGGKYVTPFGFDAQPNPPDVFAPDPTYFNVTGATAKRNASGTSALRVTSGDEVALGIEGLSGTEVNSYFYKVALVSDTGSISPLSEAVRATWLFDNVAEQGRYAVLLRDLPTGGNNIVGRIIYRTKNTRLVDDQGQTVYYFLAAVQGNEATDYMDVTPDSELVDPAPGLNDAVVFPPTLRFVASWDGRVWATGGVGYERRIIYSDRNAPEQFAAFSFLDVGNRQGGAITGLFAYYGALLVLRERSIEAITFAEDGTDYRISVLSPDVGTTATNTATVVPGVGLMFLARGGIYRITGSGSSMKLEVISQPVSKELKRITKSSLPRATAAWSPREREWWCHYPADGSTRCNRGIVFHADTGTFSLRHATPSSGTGAFEFNAIDVLPSGYFIIAPQTSWDAVDTLVNQSLQVWSGVKEEGESYEVTANIGAGGYNLVATTQGNAVASRWVSNWEDFGDDSVLKSVRYVMVEVLTEGHNELELDYSTDWKPTYTSAGTQAAAVTLTYGGDSEDKVYGPSGSVQDSVASLGTAAYSNPRVTRIRWDIGGKNHQWFRFKVSSVTKFTILRYHIEYVDKGRVALKQKAGTQR